MRRIKCNNSNAKQVLRDVEIGLGDMMSRIIGLKLWEYATPAELDEYQRIYDVINKANQKAFRIISKLDFKED